MLEILGARVSIKNYNIGVYRNNHTFGFTLVMGRVHLVRPPFVQVEASCHRVCLSVASTSPLAHNSSGSTGTRVRSSCVGSHSDACGRADG